MSGYLRTFAFSSLSILLLTAVLTWAVDPYGIWHRSCIEGINCRKTEAGTKIQLTKAYQWRSQSPQVVILGNSRPELGLDPDSPFLGGRDTYNLAIRGSGLGAQLLYLHNLIRHHKPDLVIMSIDYQDFLKSKGSKPSSRANFRVSSDYLPYRLDGSENPEYLTENLSAKIKSLWSLNSLMDAVITVFKQGARVNYTNAQGFNDALAFHGIVEHEGVVALFEQKVQEVRHSLARKSSDPSKFSEGNSNIFYLESLVQEMKALGIELKLFISPYHVRYLRLLKSEGFFDSYLEWKRSVVGALDRNGYFNESFLYDFSGVNQYTTEPVPDRIGVEMKWYWEPAHYRQELGEVLLDNMLNEKPDFQLSPENIDARLANESELVLVNLQ